MGKVLDRLYLARRRPTLGRTTKPVPSQADPLATATVVLLAPAAPYGGIGTWTNEILRDPRLRGWVVVDTARPDAILGMPFGVRLRRYLAHDLRCRAQFLGVLLRNPGCSAWLAVSPGPGFLARDLPVALIAQQLGHKVVIHLHGGDVRGFLGPPGILRHLIVRLLGDMQLVALSNDVRNAMGDAGLREQTRLVGNPLPSLPADCAWQGDIDGPILLPAFQCAEKGTFAALEAVALLPARQLRLVGDATDQVRREVARRAAALEVMDRVVMTGRLPREQVFEEMSRASIVILPSASEGFPMVILEALGLGVPVIATDVGAIPDILVSPAHEDGIRVGAVVPFTGDPRRPCRAQDLAQAIGDLCGQVAQPDSVRIAARARVERYSRQSIVTQLVEILSEVGTGSPGTELQRDHTR